MRTSTLGQVSKAVVLLALLAILEPGMVWADFWTDCDLSIEEYWLVGCFTRTGKMITPRAGHTATLLHDGMVLLVGDATGSVELYDPSTGTFAATGNTITGRRRHTATLLADGRVLIASSMQDDVSAELYDPGTGLFGATGSMTTPRNEPTATLLADGRVLIAGGWARLADQPPTALTSAELYDPSTGVFTATGDMITASRLGSHTGTLLPDGKVLIQGSPNAELYDPPSGSFRLTGAMTWPYHYTATLLLDGRVLLAGGDDDPGESAVAELYDPSTGIFTLAPEMTAARADQTATLLPDGKVLIAGSNGDGGKTLASAELYDPVLNTFSAAGDMTTDRGGQTATLLNSSEVLLTGGVFTARFSPNGGWAAHSSAELYHPSFLLRVPSQPGLFSFPEDGRDQGAILHPGTAQFASPDHPAFVGEALEIYCAGLVAGSVIPPQVAIGGRLAEILYFGVVPGFPELFQVNIRVPSGVTPGPEVPVRLIYLGRASNAVTIGVQ